MAFTATITSVTLDRTSVKLAVAFTQGAQTINKAFVYDITRVNSTSEVVKKIAAYRDLLTSRTAIFQQLKALEGSQV